MSIKNNQEQKPKINATWRPGWDERSEEFYQLCYKNGKCRYCEKLIPTVFDLCDCDPMKAARERFKIEIARVPESTEAEINKFHEPRMCRYE